VFSSFFKKVSVGSCSNEYDLILFAFCSQAVNQQEIPADMTFPKASPVSFNG